MKKPTTAKLTVRYMDGTEETYNRVREDHVFNTAALIDEVVKTNALLIETGDRLAVIPFHNVRSIEVSPPPTDLPRYAITNAREVSSAGR